MGSEVEDLTQSQICLIRADNTARHPAPQTPEDRSCLYVEDSDIWAFLSIVQVWEFPEEPR